MGCILSQCAGKGRIGALEILKSNEGARRAFWELDQSWAVSEELVTMLEFTCSMYISVNNTNGRVNDVRHELFCAKSGKVESRQLHPCKFAWKIRELYRKIRRFIQSATYCPS